MKTDRLLELAGMGQTELLEAIAKNAQELEEFVDVQGVPLGQLEFQMDAARRGLGLANKLKNPAQKKQHLSRILGNLNRIRAAIQRMIKEMEPLEGDEDEGF